MQELLKKLNESNIKIDLVDEKLDIQAPKGVMTDDLLNEIKLYKNDLIEFINLYKGKKEKYSVIPKVKLQSSYTLSSSQRRLWLLSQLKDGSTAYNMPSVFELKGDIDFTFLEKALFALIERHESLRTIFKEDETGEVRQIILNLENSNFQLQYEDLSGEDNDLEITNSIIRKEIEYTFDLSANSLLRAKLIKTSASTSIFILVMHHIISDGHSGEVMTNELFTLYNGYITGDKNSLSTLELQYKDYAAWQQDQLKNDTIKNHKLYWLQQFEGEIPVLNLPTYQARPLIKTYNGKTIYKFYNNDLSKNFNDLCQSQGSTLFMGLLATVKVLLYRYTNQNDIIIGSPIAGREHVELQNQIGIYINTLALRTQFDGKDSFYELLANVKKVTLEAYEHQIYPFDELVEQLLLKRDRSRDPLFDVMVTLQNSNNLKVKSQKPGDITIEEYKAEELAISKFDLGFTFGESEKGLKLALIYNTDLFSEEFAERILNHLETLLHSIVMKPNVSISSLNYLTDQEKYQIAEEFNTAKVDYPKDKTIIDLFEAQVNEKPDNAAVIFEEVKLTYSELNAKANQLGHYLKEQGVGAGSKIILCFDSHLEMAIVSIIGILKSGATYVPIAPDYPQDRINFIIENTGAKFIVTNSIDIPLFNDKSVRTILLDKNDFAYNPETLKNIEKDIAIQDNAYVIYTSGSTGAPKGVLVNHQNIMDYLFGLSAKIKIEDNQSFALMSTVSTDLGNTVLFSSLIFGGVIHLFSKNRLRDIYYIQQYFSTNEIDCIKIVPSYWKSLEIKGKLRSPRRMIIFGGEELSNDIVDQINLENPDLRIINHYGPTETTIGKLLHELDPNYNYNRIPVGKTFSNTQVYVVDENLSLCAFGIIGELLIAGDGVSNGYLNNQKLSEEKFIDNIFQTDGSKLYRTGDLVILHSDGNIEFKGRIDNQVKILGHRIELNEIEYALNKLEGIKTSVATVIETEEKIKRIAAYIVYDKEELVHSEILDYLRQILPGIMIPSLLIKMEKIPFTSNGKINYKELPSISEDDLLIRKYALPASDSHRTVVAIWQDVLQVNKIGITDNFFELGGHSLIVAQVINKIHKILGKNISFKDFFANPTVEGICENLSENYYKSISKASESISYPLTASQNRLWILSQLEGGSAAYNMPAALKLKGDCNYELLQKSFDTLIERYEVLRTYFKVDQEGEVRQFIVPFSSVDFVIDEVDFSNEFSDKIELEDYLQLKNNEVFDLESVSLVRASLIKISNNEYIFFLSMHHIIGDGWSSQIMSSELVQIYNALSQGVEVNLSELTIQYKDYAVWAQSEASIVKKKESEHYWVNQFLGELPVLDLPVMKTRPLVQTYNGDSLTYAFSKAFLDRIKTFSKENDITLFMALMAGVKVLLYRYSGQNDIIVGTPIAGREHPDLENQIGLFLNTLPIRTQFKENSTFLELLATQKKNLLEAYDHQNYPFDVLVNKLRLKRDTSRSALFDVLIVLQNQNELWNNDRNKIRLNTEITDYILKSRTAKVDVSFTFVEKEQLELTIEYNTDIYDPYFIGNMFSHLEILLEQLIKNPEKEIKQIDYLTEEEKFELLFDFNETTVDSPEDKTIIDLFQEQVERTPDNIAVTFEDIELTYRELNERSNQLSNYILNLKKLEKGDFVSIVIDRSEYLIITLLGVLKSGFAYVLLDKNLPEKRIDYILKDSKSKLTIDDKFLKEIKTSMKLLSKENPETEINPEDLAYLMYTSGSTGTPKGAINNHKGFLNTLRWYSEDLGISSQDKVGIISNLGFDLTQKNYFAPLLKGASVHIDFEFNPVSSKEFIHKKGISIINCAPSLFYFLLEDGYAKLSSLRKVILGGESINYSLIKDFIKNTKAEFYNSYGPSEASDVSTYYKISGEETGIIPIGKPIRNSKNFVLDENLKLVPVGATGEICIGGIGLGQGYLNNESLTSEKFIDTVYFGKIYRTGDFGKLNFKREIEFLGRKDNQVKLRGYRIELGEIENIILQFTGNIRQVAVEIKENNKEKVLVAYIVSSIAIDKSELRSFLQSSLPEYMVPGFYVVLNNLPLTANGKIDRKALPDVTEQDVIRKEYVAPNNQIEKALTIIWQELLGVEKISIRDNFFELGGHSLIISQVINRIYKELGKTLSFKDFFAYPNIEEIANRLNQNEDLLIPKAPMLATYPVSPMQLGIWVLSQSKEGSKTYSIGTQFKVDKIDLSILRKTLKFLIKRHEVLRTIFVINNNELVQKILDDENLDFEIEYQEYPDDKVIQRFYDSFFDLKEFPLFKVLVSNYKDFTRVDIRFHHIIVDGWSLENILSKEFTEIYQAIEFGLKPRLEENLVQYKDYFYFMNSNGKWNNEEISNFWKEKLRDYQPNIEFINSKPRPKTKTYKGSSFTYIFSDKFLNNIEIIAKELDTTVFSILKSITNLVLLKHSNRNDIVIGVPVNGRNDVAIENTLGLFINTLPFRTILDNDSKLIEFLTREKENLIEFFQYQQLPLLEIINACEIIRDPSRSPLFDIIIGLSYLEEIRPENKVNDLVTNAHFDLTFSFNLVNNSIRIDLNYNTDIYETSFINEVALNINLLGENIYNNLDTNVINYMALIKKDKLEMKYSDLKNKIAELIGTEIIDKTDNLFEKGMNSIKAIELTNYISNTYKREIEIIELYEQNTLEKIINLLEVDKEEIIVEVQDTIEYNLYMLPPILGMGHIYSQLAVMLKNKFNCTILEYYKIDEIYDTEKINFDILCQHFLYEILKKQKNKDVLLLGYSYGGFIAYDLTKKLEMLGYNVTLVLLDVPCHIEKSISYIDENIINKELINWGLTDKHLDINFLKNSINKKLDILKNYNLSGKVKARILCIEATDKQESTEMEKWKENTSNQFVHEYIQGSHYTVLEQFNLFKIVELIINLEN